MSSKTESEKLNAPVLRQAQPASPGQSLAAPQELLPGAVQRAVINPAMARPAEVQAIQQLSGNQAVSRMIQPKLQVSTVGDPYEQEADRVAAQVMSAPASANAAPVQRAAVPAIQRKVVSLTSGEKLFVDDSATAEQSKSLVTEAEGIIKTIKDEYGIKLDSKAGITAIKKAYSDAPAKVKKGLKIKEWKIEELRDLKAALANYAPLLGKKRKEKKLGAQPITTFSRIKQGIDVDSEDGVLDNSTAGESFSASKNISMFDVGNEITDFAKDKDNPTKDELRQGFRGTIEHELSHALLQKDNIDNFVKKMTYWEDEDTPSGKTGAEKPITEYGKTNAGEDLAETAMFYFEDPETLKKKAPERHKFLKGIVDSWNKTSTSAGGKKKKRR